MRARSLVAGLIVAAGCAGPALAQSAPRIVVGDNPSLSGAPLYVALEKGYYREAGVDVQMEMSGTTSDMAVLLATNRLQVIGGALLLSNRFVPLALALLAPVIVNIVAFHAFLAPSGVAIALVVLALELYLAWTYRAAFRPMLSPKNRDAT